MTRFPHDRRRLIDSDRIEGVSTPDSAETRRARPACVLHLSTNDTKGGGARSSYRLHRALLNAGVSSEMLVLNKSSADSTVRQLSLSTRATRRVFRWLARQRESLLLRRALRRDPRIPREAFGLATSPFGRDLLDQTGSPDLFNLHWTSGFVDLPSFFRLRGNRFPIVWRPSDIYPFSGGCHYSHSCERFEESCGCCPYLGSDSRHDLSRIELQSRVEAYQQLRPGTFQIIAQSHWMEEQVQKSRAWSRFPTTVIPNGTDLDVFRPRNRRLARAALGVPENTTVFGFVSDDVQNSRKGLPTLLKGLEELGNSSEITLLSVGGGAISSDLELPWRHVGRIEDDRLLSTVYSAMDIFVAPSLQDTFPNTVIEAIACGTPVIGTRMGGMLDVLRANESGWFFEPGDVTSLARTMTAALAFIKDNREELRGRARKQAEREFDVVVQATRYEKIYGELLDSIKKNRSQPK